MADNVIKVDFRKAAPEVGARGIAAANDNVSRASALSAKPAQTGRFATEAEARAWWAKHDAENPFEVVLRERFAAHREMFYRAAAQSKQAAPRPFSLAECLQQIEAMRPSEMLQRLLHLLVA